MIVPDREGEGFLFPIMISRKALRLAVLFDVKTSDGCGLILDTVVKGSRKQYELEVARVYDEWAKERM